MHIKLRNRLIFTLYIEHHWSYRALGKYFHLNHNRIKKIVDKEKANATEQTDTR